MYVSEIDFNKSEKINKNSEVPNINVNNLGSNGSAAKGMVLSCKIKTYLTKYCIFHHLILAYMKSYIS